MIFKRKTALPLIISTLVCGFTLPQSIAEEANTEDQPKWYQVEVIVFKSTSLNGLNTESWDVESQIKLPDNLIDFLQPYQLIAGELEMSEETDLNQELALNQKPELNQAAGQTQAFKQTEQEKALSNGESQQSKGGTVLAGTVLSDNVLGENVHNETEEKPFVLLEDSAKLLTNEAKSLSRHPEYKLVEHFAWRQPVLGASEARPIRIAGGRDFSLKFDYNGDKRLSHYEQQQLENNQSNQAANGASFNNEVLSGQSVTKQQNPNSSLYEESNAVDNSAISNKFEANIKNSDTESGQYDQFIDQIVPTLWVPEIDGDIKIHVGRYLHVKTNLFLRNPDKKEIDAIDLNLYSTEKLANLTQINQSGNFQQGESMFDRPLSQSSKTDPLLSNDVLSQNDSATNSLFANQSKQNETTNSISFDEHQFSWEINDDFLDTASDKMYIDKLFNYPMKQSRRMRSKELHYFDHPLFGILVMITPYELSTEESNEAEGNLAFLN